MQCCNVEMRVMSAGEDERGEFLLFRCPICGKSEKVYIVSQEQESHAL